MRLSARHAYLQQRTVLGEEGLVCIAHTVPRRQVSTSTPHDAAFSCAGPDAGGGIAGWRRGMLVAGASGTAAIGIVTWAASASCAHLHGSSRWLCGQPLWWLACSTAGKVAAQHTGLTTLQAAMTAAHAPEHLLLLMHLNTCCSCSVGRTMSSSGTSSSPWSLKSNRRVSS